MKTPAPFRYRLRTLCALCLAAVVLSACIGAGQLPEDHYYRLPPVSTDRLFASPLTDDPLQLEPVRASGILNERSMLYVEENSRNQVRLYAYRHWVDKPSVLIRQHFAQWLQQSGTVSRPVTEATRDHEVLRVTPTLLQFERVMAGTAVRVRIRLQFTMQLPDGTVNSRTYGVDVPVGSDKVYDTVSAFGSGLETLYAQWARETGQEIAELRQRQGISRD